MNLSHFFKALADETRLRILRLLKNGHFNVNEILFVIGGRQANISHHLKILYDHRIISRKREGALIFYGLDLNPDSIYMQFIIPLINEKTELIGNIVEDGHRLKEVYRMRKKIAEDYFNNLDEANLSQLELFNHIYSLQNLLQYYNRDMQIILDLGCGNGRNLPILSKAARTIIGIDNSPKMLQFAEHFCRQNQLNYQLKLADITALPLNDHSIDGILLNMTLHHIPDPQSAINEAYRVLSSGHKMILVELLEHNEIQMREKYADLWLGFSREQLCEWLKEAGFIIEKSMVKKDEQYQIIILIAEKNNHS